MGDALKEAIRRRRRRRRRSSSSKGTNLLRKQISSNRLKRSN